MYALVGRLDIAATTALHGSGRWRPPLVAPASVGQPLQLGKGGRGASVSTSAPQPETGAALALTDSEAPGLLADWAMGVAAAPRRRHWQRLERHWYDWPGDAGASLLLLVLNNIPVPASWQ
jgi:hypothetical protein